MRHHRHLPLPAVILSATLLAACSGEEDMGEAQAMVQNVEAPECYIARATLEEAEARPSPLRQTTITLGDSQALLCYGAPSARDREVMGGLLKYGQPERIGANEPTTIHLTSAASVGGISLEPGSYSIYAIANADEWEFFINTNWQRWGIPLNDEIRATEVGSFTATPTAIDEMVETVTYSWEPNEDGTMGEIVLEWEHTQVRLPVHAGAM